MNPSILFCFQLILVYSVNWWGIRASDSKQTITGGSAGLCNTSDWHKCISPHWYPMSLRSPWISQIQGQRVSWLLAVAMQVDVSARGEFVEEHHCSSSPIYWWISTHSEPWLEKGVIFQNLLRSFLRPIYCRLAVHTPCLKSDIDPDISNMTCTAMLWILGFPSSLYYICISYVLQSLLVT